VSAFGSVFVAIEPSRSIGNYLDIDETNHDKDSLYHHSFDLLSAAGFNAAPLFFCPTSILV
jgi:hypothetical protein